MTQLWLPSLLFSPLKQQVPPSSDLKVEQKGTTSWLISKGRCHFFAVTWLIFIPSLAKWNNISPTWIFLKLFGVPFPWPQGRNSEIDETQKVVFSIETSHLSLVWDMLASPIFRGVKDPGWPNCSFFQAAFSWKSRWQRTSKKTSSTDYSVE